MAELTETTEEEETAAKPKVNPRAIPKLRSRKGGAAIPLDDVDKRIMNLMQSSFPLVAEPFHWLANESELDLDDFKQRTQRLLDGRIIREITPIFDTRTLGYSSMLVAAKVDPDNPHRAAKIINSHPGVSHNYLRDHEFNLWFTIATPPESKLGLQGTLDVLQELTGAESIRQLPTLTMFKINMNLEMEKGTEGLKAKVEAIPPRELERQPYDDFDIAVIRALQGPMAVVDRPYDEAAAEVGLSTDDFLAHLEAMIDRKILRRVAAILFHRRAGFSANGMGVWKVDPTDVPDTGGRMAAVRGISHCYERPTYEDWPYSVFTMAHGRSKEECDAVLQSIADEHELHGADRAVLYSSTEFKKIRLRYFTPDYEAWEREHAPEAFGSGRHPRDLNSDRSAELYARALKLMPGGVNSPVRAMGSIGRDPIFIDRATGCEVTDADGNTYVDWVCSWGPLILGHANPDVIDAVIAAAVKGTSYGAATEGEVLLAEAVTERFASVEMMRMVSSGTEASMSAIRLARAATGRERLIKFAGAYHGHVDGLLAEAGSGLATQGIPASPGVPLSAAEATAIVPWNDPIAVEQAVDMYNPAAILCEPIPANMGLIPPREGFLDHLRELADRSGALLICDEVISGFRVAPGGAQELEGVRADLTVMGKVIGGGLPAAAYGGSRELMERVAPAGDVYQAGTLSGNPLAVAAGLATLDQLDGPAYARLGELTEYLAAGLNAAIAAASGDEPRACVTAKPGLLTLFMAAEAPHDFDSAKACDQDAYARFCRAMLDRGFYPPPSQFEAWFVSTAHDEKAIDRTCEAAADSLHEAFS